MNKNFKKKIRRTLSQLSDFDLHTLINAQKNKIKESSLVKLELVIERNKLSRLEKELEKRNVKQVRL